MQQPAVIQVTKRDALSAALAHEANAARQGDAGCVILRGPRGIGKTTMLDEVAARESGSGNLVLRPVPRGDTCALAHLGKLLDVTCPTPLNANTESADRYGFFRRLHSALTRLASDQFVCLLIDDLPLCNTLIPHWLDFTLRRAEHLKLFVVVASRPNLTALPDDPMADLTVHPLCRLMDVTPLPRHEVTDLVANTLDKEPEPDLAELFYQLSAGNPGLLNTLFTRLQLPKDKPGTNALHTVDTSLVASAVVAKLNSLPADARAVAAAIAAIGRIDIDLVGPLVGLAPEAVTDALRLLECEYLLWDGQPAPLCDWTHSAVLSTIAEPELTRMRTDMVVLLQNSGKPIDEVALGLPELDRVDEPWRSRLCSSPATAASSRGATDKVVIYLNKTSESAPERHTTRVQLALDQARLDLATALTDLSNVLEQSSNPSERARIAVTLALASRACGRAALGRDALIRAANELDAAAPPRPLVEAALLYVKVALPETSATAVNEAAAVPRPEGRTVEERCLLGMLADTTMRAGGPVDDAVKLARLAVSGPVRPDDWSTPAAATVLRAAGQFDESAQVLNRAVEHFAEIGDELGHCRVLTSRARGLIAVGSLTSAELDAQAAYAIAKRNHWLAHEPGISITLASAKAKLGKTGDATRLLNAVESAGIAEHPEAYPEFRFAWAWTHLAGWQWPAAIDDLYACGQALTESHQQNPVLLPWWSELMVASTRPFRDDQMADTALEHGNALVRSWETPESTALLTMTEGLATPGERGTALLIDAADQFSLLPTRLWQALANFLVGRSLVNEGDHSSARPRLRDAISLALTCGHHQWVAIAHRLLQSAGGRMRVETLTDFDVLTASERKVIERAAEGATNRDIASELFVSLRTVELHLTRAYRKLEITGRGDLHQVAGTGGPRG